MRPFLFVIALLLPGIRGAYAGLLTGQGAFVLDTAGAPRATFSNNEKLVMQQRVHNGVASGNRIVFRFVLLAPNGAQVFLHAGNAVAGSVGNAASTVSGVPISQFYSGPGIYTLRAEAELDGQMLTQQAQFTISSPNILLIYPPNGARDLSDVPLTFRWSASGAVRYRVQVGDNPSLYNSLFSQETSGGESFLSYPQNPSDPRQRLTAGQIYYWTVEGLDGTGNVIARSEAPFNFSVRATSLAKDLAVQEFEVIGQMGANGALQLRVLVKNQGNTAESNISLRVGVGGLPAAGTPIAITGFNPGETREFTVNGVMPPDQRQTLATACLELFDDNVPNNCKTLSVTRPDTLAAGPDATGASNLTREQLWEMLQQLLRERGISLEGYALDSSVTREQLQRLVDGLRGGSVQVSLTGAVVPPPSAIGAPPGTPVPTVKLPPALGGAAPPPAESSVPELWLELASVLRGKGIVLDDYVIDDKFSAEKLKQLIEGVKKGTIQVSLSGSVEPSATTVVARPPEPKVASEALPPPVVREDDDDTAEWEGMTSPAGRQATASVIKSADEWRKTWSRLQDSKAPKINFRKSVVVLIVAGAAERSERIEIESIRAGTLGVQVRYRLVGEQPIRGRRAKLRTRVPYLMKLLKVSPGLEIQFEQVKEGGDR